MRREDEVGNIGTIDNVETSGMLSLGSKLVLEAERRIVGVSNDFLALGSFSVVNFPIAGR